MSDKPYSVPPLETGPQYGYSVQIMNDPGFWGHTYIQVRDSCGNIYDYGMYPNPGDSGIINEIYGSFIGPGDIAGWDNANGHTVPAAGPGDGPVIPLTPDQYNNLSNYINNSIANPPEYNILTGDDCGTWAWSVIDHTFGINTGLGMGEPQSFLPGRKTIETWPTYRWGEQAAAKAAAAFKAAAKKWFPASYDPLVLDMGSGIQTTNLTGGVFFDGQNNGFAENTAWVGVSTGILVNDPTDAPITNGSQMFGTSTSLSGGGYAVDGFAALADLDSNHDGVINSSDTAWSGLRVWVDANGDGVTESGELETMSAAGIASISLTTTNTDTTDGNGNYIGKTATYSPIGGGTREIADESLQTDPANTVPDSYVSLSGTISALPDLLGTGTVNDLSQAMQIQANASDTTLQGYVESFVAATDDSSRNTLVDEIIYQWTGVQGISSTARGSYFDARQLEALEQFSGQTFVDPYNGTANPGSQSVAALTAAYQQLHDYVLAGLEVQTDLATLFNDIQVSLDVVTGNTQSDYSLAESQILSDLSANRTAGLTELSDFNGALHALGGDTNAGFATFRSDLSAEGADIAATFLFGAPVVNGTAGNDVITAWAGNQTVIASQGGNDTLIGSGDNETFYGSGGSNLFIGGVGNNEHFFGGSNGGTDTFIAGQGTEIFSEGWHGTAIASYASGDGNLTLQDDAGDGTLVLDSSIDRTSVSITSSTTTTITDGVSGDTITLLKNGLSGFKTLVFADGTTLNLHATGGTHNATSGSTLTGTSKDDIYKYTPGTGHTTLSDSGGNNELWLGGTLTSSNLSFSLSGNDLIITDGVSGDQITDKNFGVQTIRFADGSTMNAFQLGSTYTLSGGTTVTGGGVSDTYSFNSGTGTATISDPGGSNTLALGSGISAASLGFTGSGNDLLITDGVSGDEIVLLGQLGGQPVIQTVHFSSGSTMKLTAGLILAEATGNTVLNGTTGNDTLVGNSGSQTLNGNGGSDVFINSAGNTTINAGTGNDTYSYASGSGDLTIIETGGRNTIVLGSGISTSDVTLTASGHDLLITDGVSGDQITITGQLDVHAIVDSLVFSGGATESLEGISLTMPSGASTLYGTPGDDTLTATSGTETLFGDAGNDTYIGASGTDVLRADGWDGTNLFEIGTGVTTAYGGAGGDTYSYSSGNGLLTVIEAGGQNTLALGSGISSVTLTASGHDLVITDGVSGDTITLHDQLDTIEGVQILTFSGGTTQSLEGIALTANAASLYGTSGSDTLTATSGTETISGNGGNDIVINASGSHTAIGGSGNDTYSYHSGDGLFVIQDGAGTDTLKLGSGIATGDISLTASGHDLLITDSVSGDTITLKSQLNTTTGVSYMVFSGGTTENLEGVALTANASSLYGTAGSDTLTATSGTQTLTGNGGNDTFINAGGVHSAIGGSGDDIYSYHSGDGLLTIQDDVGNNTLKLGSGIATGDIGLAASGHDLIITDAVSGDTITLKNELSTQQAITSLVFASGTTENLHGVDFTMPSGASVLCGTVGNDTLTATDGTETLTGNGGNDKLVGATGRYTLNGGSGNDTFVGGTGTEIMNGNGGSDTFIGGSGTQSMIGNQGTGNNVFVAGTGTMDVWGGIGDTVYSYASGDGVLFIDDQGGNDTLRLASGLTAANVTASIVADGYHEDLVLSDGVTGDQIKIYAIDYGTGTQQIETLIYGDGTTASLVNNVTETATSGTTTLWGTAGNDTLTATSGTQTLIGEGGSDTFIGGSGTQSMVGNSGSGNNVFIAGTGTSSLWGGTGNTTYSYASGDGHVWIDDQGGTDTLKLGTGLTAANVTAAVVTDGSYKDLVLSDGVTGDQINIYAIDYSTGTQQIETIIYGDGTTGSLVSGVNETATAGTTTLWGTAGNDTLVGGTGTMSLVGNHTAGGNDTMIAGIGTTKAWGGNNNDTYSYASGDGTFWIDDTLGTDVLRLGSGLTQANTSMAIVTDGSFKDLVISDGVSGDQIKIYAIDYGSGTQQIETIVYGDGTTASLVNAVNETATSGTTTLWGTTGNDTLTATTGTQTLIGNGGSDTLVGGSGTQTLNGSTGANDTFIAGAGSQTALGGSANDIYSYAPGDGNFMIQDSGGTDTLKLGAGITSSNISLSESSNGYDLLITDGTTGDQIDIYHSQYSSSNSIETIMFSDGSTLQPVLTAATGNTTLNGTSGNDILAASVGNQTINGNGGSDTFIGGNGTQSLVGNTGTAGNNVFVAATGTTSAWGGTGDTIYSYASGDGALWIDDQGGTDTLRLGSGLTTANVTAAVVIDGSYKDLVLSDGTSGDQITIYAITYGTGTQQVETIVYGDGTTGSLVSGVNETATNGTTTLWGTAGNDTLVGGTGTMSLVGNHTAGGNDTMVAGIGTTSAWGGNGDDTYSYASGDGTFWIDDTLGTDTLRLGSGLTASNVTEAIVTDGSYKDLVLSDGVSGDQVKIYAIDYGTGTQKIETLIYGDGTTASLVNNVTETATSGTTTLWGTSGNDTLTATSGTQTLIGEGGGDTFIGGSGTQSMVGNSGSGNNVFIAGSGTSSLWGGTGNTNYSYASGDGHVWIDDQGGTDTLTLGSGLTAANVTMAVAVDGSYEDLVISDATSGDQINIYAINYSTGTQQIETLIYGDGTTASLVSGVNETATNGTTTLWGTTAADTLIGGTGTMNLNGNISGRANGNDTFITGIGVTTSTGGTGADTYSYAGGDGTLVISEHGGTDTLKMASGISSYNAFFGESTNAADLIITDATSGDQITISGHISTSADRVEKLVFSDGTTVDLTTAKGSASTVSTLNGTTGADILTANTNNQTLAGAGGNDSYYFGKGEGQDKINNGVSTTNTANGTLFFGHGIGDDQLWFDRVDDSGNISGSGNNLRIDIMGTTTSMTINGWYIGGSSTYKQLSEFELTDNGLKLDSQLSNLVSAMATFETNYQSAHGTAFDPTAVSSISDTTVLSAVSSDWHS